jgi:hypothetical protein
MRKAAGDVAGSADEERGGESAGEGIQTHIVRLIGKTRELKAPERSFLFSG